MLDIQLLFMALLGLIQMYIGMKMYRKINYPGLKAFIGAGLVIVVSSLISAVNIIPLHLLRYIMIVSTLAITIGLWYLWKAIESLDNLP